MPYSARLLGLGIGLSVLSTGVAEAQISPGGMGGGGMGPQQGAEEKKEGVAEAAPKTPGLLPTTPALPAAKGRRKQWKLLEIDGYFRLRTDWFKNFNLGFLDRSQDGTQDLGGAPFPRALGCSSDELDRPCNNLSSANMRLRLEPTINLTEGTSIHLQADVLDNLVLGSTPTNEVLGSYSDTNLPPLGAFGGTQAPPTKGDNSDRDSITIKRAWAEVAVPLGILKFGRMPNHWGMGINHNGGGYDPIAGTYDLDADYGDTVDRVSFSAQIPGTQLRAMLAADWAVTRLVSNQTSANRGHEGHPFDLDDDDDSDAWVGVISRLDSPQEFKDTVDRGDVAFNYGVYFEYKTQSWDFNLSDFMPGTTPDAVTSYVPREMTTYSPDVWAKLGYGRWTIEGEFVAQLGKIERLDDYGKASEADIRKYGGSLRFAWKGLDGKLRLGIEGGAASGDQWDNTPQGNTNIAFANLLGVCAAGAACAPDNKLTQFIFDRDYKVDMILWRHLVGAVTNAGYVKPFMSYELTKSIGFKVANVTSFALKPVATPGNDTMYGTEFDADVGYSADGLHIGLAYGVLFPLGAMRHEPMDALTGEDFGWGTDAVTGESNTGDPETAHTIQARAILQF